MVSCTSRTICMDNSIVWILKRYPRDTWISFFSLTSKEWHSSYNTISSWCYRMNSWWWIISCDTCRSSKTCSNTKSSCECRSCKKTKKVGRRIHSERSSCSKRCITCPPKSKRRNGEYCWNLKTSRWVGYIDTSKSGKNRNSFIDSESISYRHTKKCWISSWCKWSPVQRGRYTASSTKTTAQSFYDRIEFF